MANEVTMAVLRNAARELLRASDAVDNTRAMRRGQWDRFCEASAALRDVLRRLKEQEQRERRRASNQPKEE